MATSYHPVLSAFFKRHHRFGKSIARRGRIHHARHWRPRAPLLPDLGKALGVTEPQMIECELIPEARGLVDFFVRSWIGYPAAECYAVHMEEEIFGFHLARFRQSRAQVRQSPTKT